MGIGIPLEDNYEATLTQALAGDAGALTLYVSKTPVCTIPSGHYVVLTINPGKGTTYQENVLMESYNATTKTITVKTGGRAQERYNGDTPTALAHAVGSKIIMSDAYPVWNSLDDYVSAAGDTMTGQLNFSGTDHAGVKLISLTTAQREALTGANGMMVYDTDLGEVFHHIGGAWSAVSAGSTQPNASETVAGKIELATAAEREAGTATGGTGAKLVPTNDALVKTSSGAGDENKIPILGATGKLATGFIPTDIEIEQMATEGTAAEAITDKDVLTFATSGRLARADADAVGTTYPLAGIAKEAAAGAGSAVTYAPAGPIVDIAELPMAELARGNLTTATPQNTTGSTNTDGQDAAAKWRGQTFTASANAWENNIASVTLMLTKTLAPTGNATVRIYATSGGLPTGSELGSQALAYASIATGTNTFTFTTPVAITPGEVYAIVLDPGAGVSAPSFIAWDYEGSNVYAGGQSCTSADSGATWTAEASRDRRFTFAYSNIAGCPVFVSGTTGALTLAPGTYAKQVGKVIDRTHLMLLPTKNSIYATYTFNTATGGVTVDTTITVGFRAGLVIAQVVGATSGGTNNNGSLGFWSHGITGGRSFRITNPGTTYTPSLDASNLGYAFADQATDLTCPFTLTATSNSTLTIRRVESAHSTQVSVVVHLTIIEI
jgi:hypothetical protein